MMRTLRKGGVMIRSLGILWTSVHFRLFLQRIMFWELYILFYLILDMHPLCGGGSCTLLIVT